jgi:hypothetical protein
MPKGVALKTHKLIDAAPTRSRVNRNFPPKWREVAALTHARG